MMMGFISVTLFPVFSPDFTRVISILFLLPFLIGFVQDWLFTSGVLIPQQGIRRPDNRAFHFFLLGIRILVVSLLIFSPAVTSDAINLPLLVLLFFLLIGFIPRISALALIIFSGLTLPQSGFDPFLWAVNGLACISFFLGGGNYVIWSPEDWLVFHRLGEKVQH
jgi:hypothetical protein